MGEFPFYSPVSINAALAGEGGAVRKRLGQNFLVDPNFARKIAAVVAEHGSGRLLEIGPGLGVITNQLLDREGVEAVEIDPVLCRILRKEFADRPGFQLIEGDALVVLAEAGRFGKGLRIFGNIPYYITTDLLTTSLALDPSALTLLVQADFADRIVTGRSDSSLSVFVQNFGSWETCFRVPRGAFYPRPNVESALIRMEPRASGVHCRPDLLQQVLRKSFHARRKKISNSWKNAPGEIQPDRLFLAAEALGIDTTQRSDEITPDAYFALVNWVDTHTQSNEQSEDA